MYCFPLETTSGVLHTMHSFNTVRKGLNLCNKKVFMYNTYTESFIVVIVHLWSCILQGNGIQGTSTCGCYDCSEHGHWIFRRELWYPTRPWGWQRTEGGDQRGDLHCCKFFSPLPFSLWHCTLPPTVYITYMYTVHIYHSLFSPSTHGHMAYNLCVVLSDQHHAYCTLCSSLHVYIHVVLLAEVRGSGPILGEE